MFANALMVSLIRPSMGRLSSKILRLGKLFTRDNSLTLKNVGLVSNTTKKEYSCIKGSFELIKDKGGEGLINTKASLKRDNSMVGEGLLRIK
jgi:hypothetical protein